MKETVNTYDKNGNLVRSVTDGSEVTTREWNGFGQQTSWSDGTTEVLFRYRPDGLRHSKQVLTGSNSTLTIHCWDGQNVIGEATANGTMKALYYRTGNDLTAQDIDGTLSYYLYNVHGDVTERVNGNGIVLKSYKYDSFGNIINPAVVGNPLTPIYVDQSPFGYCGEYLDKETGEVYLRARYYDPASGRFNAEDPLGDTINLYSYCGNDPVNYVDPTGLRQETEGGGRSESKSGSKGGSSGSVSGIMQQIIDIANTAAEVARGVLGGTGTSGGGTPTPSVPQMGQQSEIPWDFTVPRNYVPSTVSNYSPQQNESLPISTIFNVLGLRFNSPKILLASVIALAKKQASLGAILEDARKYNLFNNVADDTLNSSVFSSYRGTLVLRHNIDGVTSCSIFNTIFLKKGEKEIDLNHEWGHSVQEKLLGTPKYIFTVALPSLSRAVDSAAMTYEEYYSPPMERIADIFGGVERESYAPNSGLWAWLYLIWSMLL